MTALVIVEGVVIALLIVLVAGLLRSHAEILARLHALDGGEDASRHTDGLQINRRATGTAPEAVTGVTPAGSSATVALHNSRGFVLLAFLSSGCATCRPFWSELAEAEMPRADVRPVIVTKGPSEESPGRIADLAPSGISTVMSSDTWDAFRVPVSPYFVLVEAVRGSVVGEGAAGSWEHVRNLLSAAMADAGHGSAGTAARIRRTEKTLDTAGIRPGDPSLYRNPHGEDT